MPTPPSCLRSPRLKPEFPKDEIEIPAPPFAPSESNSLFAILLPATFMAAVMSVIGIFVAQSGGGRPVYSL
ncbi:MAG: hypothetical protein GXP42_05745 [Chloroflexi bacterium]|nr:hypothetical protein [Chloroflexota bacterium]